jgi:hypothetical protein
MPGAKLTDENHGFDHGFAGTPPRGASARAAINCITC